MILQIEQKKNMKKADVLHKLTYPCPDIYLYPAANWISQLLRIRSDIFSDLRALTATKSRAWING